MALNLYHVYASLYDESAIVSCSYYLSQMYHENFQFQHFIFQAGELKIVDFEYIIAHPDILPDLLPIRGILRKKFPSDLNESVSSDLLGLLAKFRSSVVVQSKKDFLQANFAVINTCFGSVSVFSYMFTSTKHCLIYINFRSIWIRWNWKKI